jgi:hypothetical protein
MTELKLYGMRASFDEIAGKGLNRRDEVYPLPCPFSTKKLRSSARRAIGAPIMSVNNC